MTKISGKPLVPSLSAVRAVPNHIDRILRYLIYALGIKVDELDAKLRDIHQRSMRNSAGLTAFSVFDSGNGSDAATDRIRTNARLSSEKQTIIASLAGDNPITIKHLLKVLNTLPGGEWSLTAMTCEFTCERDDGDTETIVVDTKAIAAYLDGVREGSISEDTPPPLTRRVANSGQ